MGTRNEQRLARPTRRRSHRRGSIVVLAAILLIAIVGILALALDVGYMMNVRTELQRSVDAGAYAATGSLVESPTAAIVAGRQYVRTNKGPRHTLADQDIDVEIGRWNRTVRLFEDNQQPFDAVRVTARREDAPLFFGRALGD